MSIRRRTLIQLSVDERSQIQALDRSIAPAGAVEGRPLRVNDPTL
jgi:hypothetical protein